MARIVLVADDSPTIQKRAVGILKGEGFEVETVSNGVAAIRRLAVLHPVVILADVSMPGRDGYEVCEFVKKSAELSHVPVLLVASDMEPYDNARGAEVRADGIIKKPFEARELISIVEKFAEQFEAATPTLAAPAAVYTRPESTKEFVFSRDMADDTPTVIEHGVPDFSAIAEGVAFTEHAGEEAPGYSPEFPPAKMEVSYSTPSAAEIATERAPAPEFVDTMPAPEPQSAPAVETPLLVDDPLAPSPLGPLAPISPAPAPSFLDGLEAATPEPVFIEEQPALTSEPASSANEPTTMIFRAPLEIAEPIWKDETVPAPSAPEPIGSGAPEPQLEAAEPLGTPEIPVEQPPEPSPIALPMTATSLDSFSLEDATAGQVLFASGVAQFAPAEAAPMETAPMEAAPIEAAPVEGGPAEVAPEEAAPAEVAPVEAAPVEVGPAEVAPEEAAPVEVAAAEIAPGEGAPAEVAPVEAAYSVPSEEAPATEIAPPGLVPETAIAETALPEASPEAAPPEPQAEAAAPPLAFDWALFYSVVHKVVVRMSPLPVPTEVVEEMARRLADEIAMEISTESPQPKA